MMMWNLIPTDECLRLWKTFREELKNDDITDQLEKVANFFSRIPYGARTIDYYSPSDWPTPWEILFYSSFCTSSISLLMFYTLTLVPVDYEIELHLVEDDDGLYLLPIIENQYVLNYELGKVSSYPEVKELFKTLKVYSQDQVKTIR